MPQQRGRNEGVVLSISSAGVLSCSSVLLKTQTHASDFVVVKWAIPVGGVSRYGHVGHVKC